MFHYTFYVLHCVPLFIASAWYVPQCPMPVSRDIVSPQDYLGDE